MAIISIWTLEKELIGHIGKLDFAPDIECIIIHTNGVNEKATAHFIELTKSLDEDLEYRVISQALEPNESSFVLTEAMFYEWAKPFKIGNLYIYEDALLAFKDKLPRHSFIDACIDNGKSKT